MDREDAATRALGATRIAQVIPSCVILALLVGALPRPAVAELSGRYRTQGQNISVRIQSWGEDCGPRPRSASGGGGRIVEVRRAGAHLAVGSQRTDRCWSRNPRVQRRRATAGATQWQVLCETPQGDSRYERGEYTLTVVDENTLRFREVSRYDWRLEGDHCQATVILTRTYVRIPSEAPDAPEAPSPPDSPSTTRSKAPPRVDCSGDGGGAIRLDVRPSRPTIGPGERVCLRAVGRDRRGCTVPVDVTWRLSRSGRSSAAGRVDDEGCFVAAAAGGVEGRVTVLAASGSLTGRATITVRSPDIGDLVASRLAEGLESPDAGDGAPTVEARPGAAQGLGATTVRTTGASAWTLAWVVAGVAIGALMFLLLVFLVRRRRFARGEEDALATEQRISSTMPVASSVPPPSAETGLKVCPTCDRRFEDTVDYCPDDATKLVVLGREPGHQAARGSMICPKCRRGFEGGERVCPKDAVELVPYSVWRSTQLAARQPGAERGGMICPKCSARYDQSIVFCHKDGTRLEPIN